MNGEERNRFEDCSVGDWVLCGSEYPGAVMLAMKPRIRPIPKPISEADEGRFPHSWKFNRIWAEPSKVISAWMRVA